ncbi:unnamed protein product [Cuscuta epithymum]|uniref:Uncharacterized protein n=1 Tax=Cuscuta epithymum TaxID=186058 RepID=A0AAV0F0H0_9ASTE|nr:unnamed protein product [Cuscuta epithymum]
MRTSVPWSMVIRCLPNFGFPLQEADKFFSLCFVQYEVFVLEIWE